MQGQPALRSGEPSDASGVSTPSVEEIRLRTISALQKRPCLWQIDVCRAILGGGRDIISVARTGAGKTLTFWLPLLFRSDGIQIVVTPLNILGQQNIDTLAKVGVKGIFISAKTATKRNFDVSIVITVLFNQS
jgi:superfamily II DNA/RNA helicase